MATGSLFCNELLRACKENGIGLQFKYWVYPITVRSGEGGGEGRGSSGADGMSD